MDKYILNRKKMYKDFERKNKWMGIVDYKTLCICGIYLFSIIFILSKIDIGLDIKLYIFAFLFLPICAMFVCSNMMEDSVIEMFLIIIKFFITKCIYTKEKIPKGGMKNVVYKI